MEPMVLLTTLDERYLPQLQVLLTSLSIHNPGEKITLFLLHSGIPEDRLSAVRRQCEYCGYDFSPIAVADDLFREAPVTRQYPKEVKICPSLRHFVPALSSDRPQAVGH